MTFSIRFRCYFFALSPAVAGAFANRFGLRVHNFLGTSETGGIAYDRDGNASLGGQSVGTVLDGVSVSIGPRGRLRVTSEAVLRPHALSPDGPASFLLSDLGDLTPDGHIRLRGRARSLAKIGGRRVDPVEVEATLKNLPAVCDAVVIVTTGSTGDRLAAVVETNATPSEIRAELARRLPQWKIPRRILCSLELPRDPRGKLRRSAAEALLEHMPKQDP